MKLLLALNVLLNLGSTVTAAAVPLAPLLDLVNGTQTNGGYIVVLKDGSDPLSILNTLNIAPFASKVFYDALSGFSGKFDAATLALIRAQPSVAYVEPDTAVSIRVSQKNPPYGLAIVSNTLPQGTYNFRAGGGKGITAYVIDTGIYTQHSQFEGRATFGYNAINNVRTDDEGHGTHVAGTIGAKTYGVAKQVHLVAVKVLDSQGSGYTSDVIDGLNWVASHSNPNACIINMSLGGTHSDALNAAVNKLYNKGCTVVVSAGNDGRAVGTDSPAGTPNAVTVAAIARNYQRPSYSNFGGKVDIFAPGDNVLSCGISGPQSTKILSGTSMASPHVAGLMAYYSSFDSNHSPAHLYSVLIANSRKGVVVGPGAGSPNRVLYNGFK